VPITNVFDKPLKESQVFPLSNSQSTGSDQVTEVCHTVSSHAAQTIQESSDRFSVNQASSQTFSRIQEGFSLNSSKEAMQEASEGFSMSIPSSQSIGSLQGPDEEYSITHSHSQTHIAHIDRFPINAVTNSDTVGQDNEANIVNIDRDHRTVVEKSQEVT